MQYQTKKKTGSLFFKIRKRLRYIRCEYRARKTGWFYHNHCHDTVVSKKEFYIQLSNFSPQENLLQLLLRGKSHPDYDILLTLVSAKFEHLGSLVFPVNRRKRARKPPTQTYLSELFEGFYETPEEVAWRLQLINREHCELSTLSEERLLLEETAQRVFRKLLFVVGTCVPCIADPVELWHWDTYRCFLEYAIEHDDFSFFAPCAVQNIMQAIPEGLPEKVSRRAFILKLVPNELREKIVYSTENCSIRK